MTKQTEERLNLAARLGAVRPAAPPTSDMVELLRLLRDPQSGQLVVEVAGQRYIRLTEVTDKKIGQYILKLVAHLLVFTNGMIATEGGVKSIYLPKMSEVPEPPVESLPAAGSPEPLAPPTGRPATPEPPSSPPPVIPSLPAQPRVGPLSAPRRPPEPAPEPARRGLFGRPKPAPEAKLPPLNLAAQINDIAQNRLAMSPLASRTWLEITTDPGGGIRINVNGTVYSSPDEIPDPEVKELIKASIKQWERS